MTTAGKTFIPFAKPTLSQAAIEEVTDCLQSGWITTGPRTQKFEAQLKAYLGAAHVSCLNSATAGLHLSLLALNLKPGDEVITSAHTFVATLNTIVLAGGKPVLIDIDLNTRNMDVAQIEKAITPNTKAILPVHFAGFPVDLDPIYALAKAYNLRIIEDAAQAIGTKYKNKLIGAFGDTQVFSFHPNKNMTTGEGGCVSSSDEALIKSVNLLRFHGIDRSAFNRFAKGGSQEYDVIAPGYKYNMLDIQAALGIHQIERLDHFNQARTKLAETYQTALSNVQGISLPSMPSYNCTPSWHLYTILIDSKRMTRTAFMERLKSRNIGTGLHYQPVYLYQYYQETFGFTPEQFPNATQCGEQIVSLPLFPSLTNDEQTYIIETIKEVISE